MSSVLLYSYGQKRMESCFKLTQFSCTVHIHTHHALQPLAVHSLADVDLFRLFRQYLKCYLLIGMRLWVCAYTMCMRSNACATALCGDQRATPEVSSPFHTIQASSLISAAPEEAGITDVRQGICLFPTGVPMTELRTQCFYLLICLSGLRSILI